jgi:hypothetical protein
MKLKANDTLHVSSVKPDNLAPGEEFEVSDDIGRQLVEMGRATEVKAKASDHPAEKPTAKEKAEPALLNKMTAPPSNKAVKARKGK